MISLTLKATNWRCPIDATDDDVQVTLPAISQRWEGKALFVVRTDSTANTATLIAHADNTIDGGPDYAVVQGQPFWMIADGDSETWRVVSDPTLTTQEADATLVIGAAVYQSAAGHVDKARANAVGTSLVTGLAGQAITSAASGLIRTGGVMTLTTGEWDVVTGGSGGLTYNAEYFLDPTTAGMITATPPMTTGQLVVPIGIALSATRMYIRIDYPILL